ncbi:MAG: hypothetical protein KTU85_03010 [Acidimicrobiia bacterium]|nr:hypothetical protein [Acidimicrobiia bacterium]
MSDKTVGCLSDGRFGGLPDEFVADSPDGWVECSSGEIVGRLPDGLVEGSSDKVLADLSGEAAGCSPDGRVEGTSDGTVGRSPNEIVGASTTETAADTPDGLIEGSSREIIGRLPDGLVEGSSDKVLADLHIRPSAKHTTDTTPKREEPAKPTRLYYTLLQAQIDDANHTRRWGHEEVTRNVNDVCLSMFPSTFRHYCTALLIALFAIGCSAGEAQVDRAEMMSVMRQQILEALPTASPTQREILADFYVTPGEADRAASEVVECASAQGVTVTPVWQDAGMQFNITGGATSEIAAANYAIYENYQQTLFWLINNTLGLQNALSSEEVERRNQLVLDCLVAQGFDVGSWPDVQSEPDASVEAECVDSAMTKLGNS